MTNTANAVNVSIRTGKQLAPMQRPLWMSQRSHPDSPTQNMALLTHIDGDVDPARLSAAFDQVVQASDVLRTRIVESDGVASVHLDAVAQEPQLVDIPRDHAQLWATDRVGTPLDMSVRGWDSVQLLHPDGTMSWYLALHHTITDATASSLIFAATAAVYHGESVEFDSYYQWAATKSTSSSKRARRARDHWKQRSASEPIARLYEAAAPARPPADRLDLPLDDALLADAHDRLTGDFKMLSADLAWSALLITTSAVYLHQVGRTSDLSIGLPVHNRSDAAARSLLGPVMEVFPVDIHIEPGQSFRELHRAVSRSVLQTLSNAEAGTAPAGDYEAIVNVIPRGEVGAFGDAPTSTQWIHSGAIDAAHLFRVQLTAYDDKLALDLNRSVAPEAQRDRAADHFLGILRAGLSNPDHAIDRSICTTEEIERLEAWESTPALERDEATIISMLRSSLRDMRAVALSNHDNTGRHSGAVLWARVLRTAAWLQQQGVKPGDRVGINMPRTPDAVIAIVSTLVTGASFVPLDPDQPDVRLHELAAHAECRLVLRSVPEFSDLQAPELAAIAQSFDQPSSGPALDDEAYVIFTSGSTGTPKGVPITHRGLASYIRFAARSYRAGGDRPVVPLFSSLSFDLTVTSLFLPLVSGGEVVTIEEGGAPALATLATTNKLTWLKATPSHLEILCRLLPDQNGLKTIVVGGEAFGSGLARRLAAAAPNAQIFNEYGPTEAVVGCMIHQVDARTNSDRDEVPIGRPAPGVTLRIVGPGGSERVPIGSVGELCITHDGLTAGYLDSANDTDRFVEIEGLRYYRSGDLVRLADDMTAVYLGRADEQVKIGGRRLEPTEVEDALATHPAIAQAAVRLWSPTVQQPEARCVRCGVASNIPGIILDGDEVCDLCHSYDRVAPQAESWFRDLEDLQAKQLDARAARSGEYDCLHLLSGGKDSTYALYRLVELGFRPFVMTLDNGFISEEALDNVRRSVADLGVDYEIATTDAMNDIFRDSLERHSNVCHGCYKTIYTLATTKAVELGIPMIMTGLSRGQLFETRLIPQQFVAGRFDPAAIDRAVLDARKIYHRLDDGPNRLLDTTVFDSDDVFDQVEYVDFYRYIDVELADMLAYLDESAPWVRPSDTGRSTNCLINAAGIHAHLTEQGYHNYALPYAWDVRLGHKTRQEAIEELDDQLDLTSVRSMLSEIDYEPRTRSVLSAWLELEEGAAVAPTPAELRAFLRDRLPHYAIPAAFITVESLPLSTNGKLDTAALPAPQRVHRSGASLQVAPETANERRIVEVWERVLATEPIGLDDDFFALGGDSLAALEMIVGLSDAFERDIPEDVAFNYTTPRLLAQALDGHETNDGNGQDAARVPPAMAWTTHNPPPLSSGEQAILFEQALRPESTMYNIGRLYDVDGLVDAGAFARSLRLVAERHVPLSWSYGSTRRKLAPDAAVVAEDAGVAIHRSALQSRVADFHRQPFDLENGPLLRALVQPLTDGTTTIVLACHHASGDSDSFAHLWEQTNRVMAGAAPISPRTDYATYRQWQENELDAEDFAYWAIDPETPSPARLAIHGPAESGKGETATDGFICQQSAVSPHVLRSAARSTGFAAALSAVCATLARYSDGDHVEVGVVTSTKGLSNTDSPLGYFLNTLPAMLDCDPDRKVADVLAEAATTSVANFAHRTVPYSRIVVDRRAVAPDRPIPTVYLAYDELPTTSLGGLATRQKVLSNGNAVTDATFFVEVRDTHVDVSLEYRGSVLDPKMAQQLLDDFDAMLGATIEQPLASVGDIVLPSTGAQIVHGPEPKLTAESVLPQILHHTKSAGSKTAVLCGDETLSWTELGQRSRALASALQNVGVSQGDQVLVCLERSADLVASIVAILRLGAVYVPIDPQYPEPRITLIAQQSSARVAITRSRLTHSGLTDCDIDPVGIGNAVVDVNVDIDHAGNDDAYVIFTSGSTGLPRGVPVSHANLASSTLARPAFYGDDPERFLLISSAAFDSSIVGLFWPLATGNTIVLPTDEQQRDVDALATIIDSADITHTLMVPTLYQALLDRAIRDSRWPRQVIVAGEACPPALVRQHHRSHPTSRLTNEYGPTEATVWATAHHCEPDSGDGSWASSTPIGGPIPGTWICVVDEFGDPRPSGVSGELIVGGAGVTGGYLRDPASTSAKFGNVETGRFFRTGDRATLRDGTAYFGGRVDDQLNVGGNRVEPGDIEQVILHDLSVGAAIVTATDPRSLEQRISQSEPSVLSTAMQQASGDPDPANTLSLLLRATSGRHIRLVAHLEPAANQVIDLDSLRSHVAKELPPSLRPSEWAVHERLARTPNGKLDREAARELPVNRPVEMVESTSDTVSPTSQVLRRVRALFAQVLGLPGVEPDQSFFDLGGHSLLATDLLSRLHHEFTTELTVTSLYENPTPRGLAALLREPATTTFKHQYLVPIQTRGTKPPIFGVHVLGQNGAYYRPLADTLGPDQPLYGLGLPGLTLALTDEGGPAQPTDVKTIAGLYAEEIQQCAPTGPVSLAAVSLGSVVAYELAAQLQRSGRQVALLVFFDAAGPAAEQFGPTIRDRAELHWGKLRANPTTYIQARIANFQEKSRRNIERMTLWTRHRLGLDVSDDLRIRQFIEANWTSQFAYDFQPTSVPLLVLQAQEDQFLSGLADFGMGWTEVAEAGVQVCSVPGGHLSMLSEPFVDRVAEVIAEGQIKALDKLVSASRANSLDETLARALNEGRFVSEVQRQLLTPTGVASQLVLDADQTLRANAEQARLASQEIRTAMEAAGEHLSIAPTPERLQNVSVRASISDNGTATPRIAAIAQLLGTLGYQLQEPVAAGAWDAFAEANQACVLIRVDDSTTRVMLSWDRPATGPAAKQATAKQATSPNDVTDSQDLGVFLGTPQAMILDLLGLADPTANDAIVDVGSGDGRVLIEAARAFGCRARGIENNPALVTQARQAARAAEVSDLVEVIEADASHADLDEATIVFVFLPAHVTATLLPGLLARMRPGSVLVAHEQLAARWPVEPDERHLLVRGGLTVAYLWRIA